ncbi:MAG: trypsin-like peptidase domain-containing protein [Candidatus Fervidibacter sacchari]
MVRYLLALSVLMASLTTAQEAVDWSSIVEKVMPAVVTIVSADEKDIVQGSGFIISSDGKIVTNFHVVAGKRNILARRSDGSFLVIKGILASDKANDLAILQAEGRNLPFVLLGNSDKAKVGETICVIGSPMLLEGTVSAGIISAVRKLRDGRKLLQITAPISKGNSGSPVFNRKGEVIGVASFALSEGQNLNFAVPSNAVKVLLKRLGITFNPLPPSPTLEERLERAYREAIQAAQKIEDAQARSLALRDIAEAMVEVGQFDLAIQVAQKIEDALDRSWALKDIAEAMAEAGQFDLALQVAQKIEDARDRSLVLRFIAEAMAKAGQFDLAVQVAQRIEEAWIRSLALRDIAAVIARTGQFDLAVQVAQKIEYALDRSWALRDIVVAIARAGQFDFAIQVAQKIEYASARSSALRFIASTMASTRQFDRAVEVAETIDEPIARLQAFADIIVAKQKARKGETGKR